MISRQRIYEGTKRAIKLYSLYLCPTMGYQDGIHTCFQPSKDPNTFDKRILGIYNKTRVFACPKSWRWHVVPPTLQERRAQINEVEQLTELGFLSARNTKKEKQL